MPDGYYLTTADARTLSQMMTEWRRKHPTLRYSGDEDTADAPEIYIAYTPVGGIPALSGVTPGAAECTIRQILRDVPSVVVSQVTARTVYNLSSTAVPPATTVLTVRDKFGAFIAVTAPGGDQACRSLLVGLGPNVCMTGEIPLGLGGCANVGPATLAFTFDATAGTGSSGGWVSSEFTTAAGPHTKVTYFIDEFGEARVKITSGSTTQYMTFDGCQPGDKSRWVTASCAWCDAAWLSGCVGNKLAVLITCGCPPVCGTVHLGPVVSYRQVAHDPASPGTMDVGWGSITNPILLHFGYTYRRTDPSPALLLTPFPDYVAAEYKIWGAQFNSPFPGVSGVDNAPNVYVVLYDKVYSVGDFCMTIEVWQTTVDGDGNFHANLFARAGVDVTGSFPVGPNWVGAAGSGPAEAYLTPIPAPVYDPCTPGTGTGTGTGTTSPPVDCEGCALVGNSGTLVIPDGPDAGTYGSDSPWFDPGGGPSATFTRPGETSSFADIVCGDSGAAAITTVGIAYATAVTCGPPAVFVFPGAAFGATGNVTVTT